MGWKNLILAAISLLAVMLSSAAASAIVFAKNVDSQMKDTIEGDLQLLDRLQWWKNSDAMTRIYHLDTINARTVRQWLESRVQYIIDQNHRLDASAILPLNPSSQSNIDYVYRINNQVGQNSVSALNLGTTLYASSRRASMKLAFDVDGVGLLPLTSPRIGLLQVLQPLLLPLSESGENSNSLNLVNRVYRLATLFHEARHSDGHGENLGFAHSVCPQGHTYAGLPACDSAANGAYRVGALFIESVMRGCEVCSVGEKEALKIIYADYLSRILSPLKDTPVPMEALSDDSILNGHQRACLVQRQLGGATSAYCEEQLVRKPLEWDDSPEAW